MYWHIDTDIVSLIILIFMYIYNVRMLTQGEPSIRTRSFLRCFWYGIVVTVIDIAASIIMEVPVNRVVYHLLMTLYMIAIESVIVQWFLYSLAILYPQDAHRKRTATLLVVIPYFIYALLVCSNPWTGLFYTLGPENVYQRGPLFMLMVVVYSLYALALFVVTIARRKHIPDAYSGGILVMMPVVLSISIAVQLLNPGWLMILPGYMLCLVLASLFLQTLNTKANRVLVQSLSYAASTDSLTGLYNRAGMEGKVQQSLLIQPGCRCMVAVVDIDDLKHINDTLGHPEGDRAIRAVGTTLKGHFRATDIVARFGGDEFLVYLIGDMNEIQAHRSLRRLIDKTAELRVGEEDELQLHVSIGAVFGTVGSDDFKALCHRADVALYQVKRRGKNGYALYDPKMEIDPPRVETPKDITVS